MSKNFNRRVLAYAIARYTQYQMKSYEQPMSIEQLRDVLLEVEASIMISRSA
jgi:hypothetical protein